MCAVGITGMEKPIAASHRIHEEVLDAAVQEYAETVREQCAEELKEAGTDAKNVGVEETNPRRPHFVVTGESAETGTGD